MQLIAVIAGQDGFILPAQDFAQGGLAFQADEQIAVGYGGVRAAVLFDFFGVYMVGEGEHLAVLILYYRRGFVEGKVEKAVGHF